MLKDARGLLHLRSKEARICSLWTNHYHLARFHVALINSANQTERARLRSKHYRVTSLAGSIGNAAHRKRPKPARIANSEHAVTRHHHHGKRALYPAQGVAYRLRKC